MKRGTRTLLGAVLAASMTVSLASVGAAAAESDAADKIVNIGVTDSLGGVNPLAIDQTEINKYSIDLEFLPLVELDSDLNFQGMLADSVTTEDNQNFTVHLDENAAWSDGTPVTAEDVEFTVLRLASPVIGNATMMLYAFEGVGDDGFVEEGATSIDGVQVIDDKTVQFTSKEPMALTTFENTYGRYIHTLPKHVLENYSDEELQTLDWFNHPDVVSGPYFLTDYDTEHYVTYEANESYWKGAPKIGKLNIKIVEGSQIYAGLQSGEIDITHHTMTAIPQEDYESIESLENVDVVYGLPITNQSAFIQTANIPDARVREALVYAIDRNQLVEQLLKGHGEVVDGFLSSASPFYDDSITPMTYDPEKAKELLDEAAMDFSDIYYEGGQSLVTVKDNADTYNSTDAINDPSVSVGAQTGSIQLDLAQKNSPDADIVSLPKVTDIISELLAGKLDAAYIETAVAESYQKNYPDLEIVADVPYEVEGSSIGVSKGNAELLAAVNEAIAAAKADGSLEEFIAEANAQASGEKYEGLLDENGEAAADETEAVTE